MFCPQCGTSNADTAITCVQCGRTLQAAPPVAMQPGVVIPPGGVQVQNYLVFAILVTVLCCLPFGIPAIVYAAQVNGKLQSGDIAGAQAASKNAKMWCWIAFGVGLGASLIYALIAIIALIGSNMNH